MHGAPGRTHATARPAVNARRVSALQSPQGILAVPFAIGFFSLSLSSGARAEVARRADGPPARLRIPQA